MLRVGSLFSGIGGLDLGLEWTGAFKTTWFVENDHHAQAVLRERWPGTPVYADITTTDFRSVPAVDVLTGGFPCQDISNAGKRAGIEGSRSSLWKHYARAISELRPRYAFIENVSALTRRGLDVVLCDLAALGYDAEWHCVPASAVGAPHQRDRIAIIVYVNDGQRQENQVCTRRNSSGGGLDVAYPYGSGCIHGQAGEQSNQGRERALGDARQSGEDVADSCCEGLPGQCESVRSEQAHAINSKFGWWAVEPDVGRVAHGVPLRVERIKRLGNAVVPQWAQVFGEAIKEIERSGVRR